jgi:hypothetical protein
MNKVYAEVEKLAERAHKTMNEVQAILWRADTLTSGGKKKIEELIRDARRDLRAAGALVQKEN